VIFIVLFSIFYFGLVRIIRVIGAIRG